MNHSSYSLERIGVVHFPPLVRELRRMSRSGWIIAAPTLVGLVASLVASSAYGLTVWWPAIISVSLWFGFAWGRNQAARLAELEAAGGIEQWRVIPNHPSPPMFWIAVESARSCRNRWLLLCAAAVPLVVGIDLLLDARWPPYPGGDGLSPQGVGGCAIACVLGSYFAKRAFGFALFASLGIPSVQEARLMAENIFAPASAAKRTLWDRVYASQGSNLAVLIGLVFAWLARVLLLAVVSAPAWLALLCVWMSIVGGVGYLIEVIAAVVILLAWRPMVNYVEQIGSSVDYLWDWWVLGLE